MSRLSYRRQCLCRNCHRFHFLLELMRVSICFGVAFVACAALADVGALLLRMSLGLLLVLLLSNIGIRRVVALLQAMQQGFMGTVEVRNSAS